MTQESAFEYIRHGQINFFRLPRVELGPDGAPLYRGAGAVLLGVPHDAGTTHNPGARFAPYHVRRTSAVVQSFHPTHQIDVFGALRALDGGNIAVPPFDREKTRAIIQEEIAAVVRAEAVPFVVGGDHSITLPILRALAAVHGPVACIHVDAHFDTSGPEVWGEDHHHGTFMRHALAEGLIAPGQLHQVGQRAPWSSRHEGELLRQHGAHLYSSAAIDEGSIATIARSIRQAVGPRPVYLSFDVDAVDPAFAPGTGTPVPGGLSAREALRFLRELRGVQLAGFDVVEVLPALDHADMTCHLAGHILYEALALFALTR